MITGTFVIDNIGGGEAITIPGTLSGFQEFMIREQGGAATTRFQVRAPLISSPLVTFAAGEPWQFRRLGGFKSGDTIGFMHVLDVASVTFSIIGI